ncbi:CDP-glycerol glycerophosphotransferase family protein [Halomonas heilongjiangensis]|uniref:CDP-glycerol glycerophosphotransferase family protein n=1 Tax=Halomonas heilongjiangensis TaxID=1387883 RepID=UPI001473DC28|nr:CDP-glycerol glycerophosphotransferase family protein [Halomonas heilongjiangensis]
MLLFLTFFLVFVSAVVFGALTASAIFLVLAAAALQILLSLYKKIYSAVVPLEKMKETLADVYPEYLDKVSLLLVLTPIMAGINIMLGLVWVASGYLAASRAIWRIARRVAARKKILKENKDAYVSDSPRVIAYVSGLENVAYQINQWIPVLENIEKQVAIVVRERTVFAGMDKTSIPVYFARTQFDVEFLLATAGSARTVLYPANTMKNVQSLRHYRLNHFFINHGESDKAVNQNKLLMAYDKLLVGGPLAERRLREAGLPLREDQVEYVGRPQAEALLDVVEGEHQIRTILYAPTWEGFVEDVNYSSVSEFGYTLLESLKKEGKFNVIFKPHPYTGERNKRNQEWLKRINSLCQRDGVEIVDGSIHEVMNRCDLLVTDISSVLNEFLVTNKPIILCNVKNSSEDELATKFPSSQGAYVLANGEEVRELITHISEEDTLAGKRRAVRRDSLSDFPEGAMKRFKDIIEKSVDNAA